MSYPYQYNGSEDILWGGLSERESFNNTTHTVINVSHTKYEDSDFWIPLNDGVYDNREDTDNFAEAVNTVREQLQTNTQLFIHCAYGQSRSVIVLATAISAEENIPLETVLETMEDENPQIDPSPSLYTKAETYLRHQIN